MFVISAPYFNFTEILQMYSAAGPKVSFLSNNTQKMFFFSSRHQRERAQPCMHETLKEGYSPKQDSGCKMIISILYFKRHKNHAC